MILWLWDLPPLEWFLKTFFFPVHSTLGTFGDDDVLDKVMFYFLTYIHITYLHTYLNSMSWSAQYIYSLQYCFPLLDASCQCSCALWDWLICHRKLMHVKHSVMLLFLSKWLYNLIWVQALMYATMHVGLSDEHPKKRDFTFFEVAFKKRNPKILSSRIHKTLYKNCWF